MLYREPKLLKAISALVAAVKFVVSVLYREPKLLKVVKTKLVGFQKHIVSVLYREPKLLKDCTVRRAE